MDQPPHPRLGDSTRPVADDTPRILKQSLRVAKVISSSGDEVHLPSPNEPTAQLKGQGGPEGRWSRPPHPACWWQRLEPKSPKPQFRAFLLPETGSGQEWGCHGLNSDTIPQISVHSEPYIGLMWTHGLGSVKVRTQDEVTLD